MQVVYRANDGKEFDHEYECVEYEWQLDRKEAMSQIKFYDKDGNELQNKMTQETYEKVMTIIVPTEEAVNAVMDIGSYCGFNCYECIDSVGTWKWNDKYEQFVLCE